MQLAIFRGLLGLGLWLITSTAAASYAELEKKLQFNQLRADFVQTLLTDSHRVISESRGKLLVVREKLVWKVSQPFKQDVFVDGNKVKLVDYDFETVQINELTNQLGQLPLLLLTGRLEKARSHYNVTSLGENAFRLEPLGKLQTAFEKAEIYFQNQKPQKMLIYDAFSQLTRVDFHQVNLDQPIALKQLEPTYPQHFDVITED